SFFDPDDVNHVAYVSYLLDPQGRLLGRDREVIANSVLESQEQHKRWRESGGAYGPVVPPTGFDIQPAPDGQFELICKAGDVHQSLGSFPSRQIAAAWAYDETEWMVAELAQRPTLYQSRVATHVRRANPDLTYRNPNGNWALDKTI
ncbi:hypothetical protein OY671_009062, partial [Metschnikowia pulcherrima]